MCCGRPGQWWDLSTMVTDIIMSPQLKGGGRRGACYFWCGSCWLLVCTLVSSTKWVDFDQTWTDTLLGWGKEVIRFWCPWPHFQGHTSTLNVNFRHCKWVEFHQTWTDILLGRGKEVIKFWWLWPHFQPNDRVWPNFMYCNVGMVWRFD